jgi:surfactin synthase thioesterase subunit
VFEHRRWLKRFRRSASDSTVLLCFHHAGGSAAMFRDLPPLLPTSVDPVAVQLPGRADLYEEPLYYKVEHLVDDLLGVIGPLLDRPFAFLGDSMGARVGWSLAHAMRAMVRTLRADLTVLGTHTYQADTPGFRRIAEVIAGDLGRGRPFLLQQAKE